MVILNESDDPESHSSRVRAEFSSIGPDRDPAIFPESLNYSAAQPPRRHRLRGTRRRVSPGPPPSLYWTAGNDRRTERPNFGSTGSPYGAVLTGSPYGAVLLKAAGPPEWSDQLGKT
eukprot:756413-Hanusia_phi.AAC.8